MSQKQTNDLYGQTRSLNLGIAMDVGVTAAFIYQEIDFLKDKGKRKDGFIYKTAAELGERFPIYSVNTIHRAITALVEGGYIEKKIKRANGSPTMHLKIIKILSPTPNKANVKMQNGNTQIGENRFTQIGENINSSTHSNPQQQGEGGLFIETKVGSSTDSTPEIGAAIEINSTDSPSSSLQGKPSATSVRNELVEQESDASANQVNGRLTNQPNNVLTNEQWKQLTDLLTPGEEYKPEFNTILSQVLASANPELATKNPMSQLLSAVKHRANDSYISDKPHLKTMSVFLKSEIGGVPVWLSCMTEGNKRKKMF
jgi:hypothetical protein